MVSNPIFEKSYNEVIKKDPRFNPELLYLFFRGKYSLRTLKKYVYTNDVGNNFLHLWLEEFIPYFNEFEKQYPETTEEIYTALEKKGINNVIEQVVKKLKLSDVIVMQNLRYKRKKHLLNYYDVVFNNKILITACRNERDVEFNEEYSKVICNLLDKGIDPVGLSKILGDNLDDIASMHKEVAKYRKNFLRDKSARKNNKMLKNAKALLKVAENLDNINSNGIFTYENAYAISQFCESYFNDWSYAFKKDSEDNSEYKKRKKTFLLVNSWKSKRY